MSTARRVGATVFLGIVSGLWFWFGNADLAPSSSVHDVVHSVVVGTVVIATMVLVPWLVSRWWVISALAGPIITLAILGAAGWTVYEDGTAAPLNYTIAYFLILIGLTWLLLVWLHNALWPRREREGRDAPGEASGEVDRDDRPQSDQPG